MKTLSAYLKALADPTRLKITRLLLERELAVCELAFILRTSQPAISQHLRRLKALGLINERHDGSTCFCSMSRDRLREIEAMLQGFFDSPLRDMPDLAAEADRLSEIPADEQLRGCKDR